MSITLPYVGLCTYIVHHTVGWKTHLLGIYMGSCLQWFSETLQVQGYHFLKNWPAQSHQHIEVLKLLWEPIFFQFHFILGSKRCALTRGFQIWSPNSNQKYPIDPFSTVCWPKGVKYYPIWILRLDLESSRQGASFRTQNEEKLKTIFGFA